MRETQGVGACDLGIVPGQASEVCRVMGTQTSGKFVKNKSDSLPRPLHMERSAGNDTTNAPAPLLRGAANDTDRPPKSPGLSAAVP